MSTSPMMNVANIMAMYLFSEAGDFKFFETNTPHAAPIMVEP